MRSSVVIFFLILFILFFSLSVSTNNNLNAWLFIAPEKTKCVRSTINIISTNCGLTFLLKKFFVTVSWSQGFLRLWSKRYTNWILSKTSTGWIEYLLILWKFLKVFEMNIWEYLKVSELFNTLFSKILWGWRLKGWLYKPCKKRPMKIPYIFLTSQVLVIFPDFLAILPNFLNFSVSTH